MSSLLCSVASYLSLFLFSGCLLIRSASVTNPAKTDEDALDYSSSGECVYKLQVWTPNQDVLQRLQRLEERCEAAGMNLDREVALMRSQVAREMIEAMNLTHRVEKTVLELRLQDAQHSISIKELKMEIMSVKGENGKMLELVNSMKLSGTSPFNSNNLLTSLVGTEGGDQASIPNQLEIVLNTINVLKNGVGDLKAEWMLAKRQILEIRSENVQLRSGQQAISDDSARLKNAIETLKTDNGRLKLQFQEWMAGEVTRKSRPGQRSTEQEDQLLSGVQTQMTELRLMTQHLERELMRLRQENSEVRKELLTSALNPNRNLSKEELNRILDRLTAIQNASYTSSTFPKKVISIPRDCNDVYANGHLASGVFQIQPDGVQQLENVYCEMVNGSGWTVVQRRIDGTLNFVRKWNEYKYGFGNPYGEFWIGNEMLYRLTTQQDYRLRIDISDFEGRKAFAEYDTFRVDSEVTKYKLRVLGYKGNSGDSLSYHDGMAFSTEDMDNDHHMRNCAQENKGGWWFNSCFSSNLNGIYHYGRYPERSGSSSYPDGIVWFTLKETEYYSFKHVEMKIKPA